jgi:hypothetical protein
VPPPEKEKAKPGLFRASSCGSPWSIELQLMLLNVHMDGVGVEVGRLDRTTETAERTEIVPFLCWSLAHERVPPRKGKKQKPIFPCFFPRVPVVN